MHHTALAWSTRAAVPAVRPAGRRSPVDVRHDPMVIGGRLQQPAGSPFPDAEISQARVVRGCAGALAYSLPATRLPMDRVRSRRCAIVYSAVPARPISCAHAVWLLRSSGDLPDPGDSGGGVSHACARVLDRTPDLREDPSSRAAGAQEAAIPCVRAAGHQPDTRCPGACR